MMCKWRYHCGIPCPGSNIPAYSCDVKQFVTCFYEPKPLYKFQTNILRIHFDGLTNLLLDNWPRKGCVS